jgi:nifR3 family TIM-barrel protein
MSSKYSFFMREVQAARIEAQKDCIQVSRAAFSEHGFAPACFPFAAVVFTSQVIYNGDMLQIGSLKLKNWLVMAPMAGYTNLPFRLMVKKLGAGLVTTEMISAAGIARGQKKTMGYLESHPDEKPLCVQIFGVSPQLMARAAQIAVEKGADLVDINTGCPVKKVAKTGAGAALLRDLKVLAEIVSAVRLACPVPLTVKMRTGWSPGRPMVCEAARIVEDCGADAVTVHPRFATQGYAVPAEWVWIGRVKAQVKIPVIGNGDVRDPSQALQMRNETGCDGVMIGRGALVSPWIFRQILHREKGLPVSEPGLAERRALILEHFHRLCASMGERNASLAIRGLLLRYSKGLPYSTRFRDHISKIKDTASLVSTMDAYFSTLAKNES